GAALRVPSRADLRARAAGRRDQPRAAAHAERAARGDGRAPGDGGRHHPPAARSVLRDRHAEPGGPVGHLSPARLAARPLPAAAGARLSGRGRRTHPARRRRPPRPDRARAAGARRRGRAGAARRGRAGARQRCVARLRAGIAHAQPPASGSTRGPVAARRHRAAARGPRLRIAARPRPRAARGRAGAVPGGGLSPAGAGRRRRRARNAGQGDPARGAGGLSMPAPRLPSLRSLSARLLSLARPRGPEPLPVALDRRRIYLLPTGLGWFFAALLLAMGVGALNYNNNPALLLALLLAGAANASLMAAHLQLSGLQVFAVEAEPVPAGAPLQVHVHVRAPRGRQRRGLRLARGEHAGVLSLDDGVGQAVLALPTHQRGWLAPGRLRISTTRPLGLARAWAWVWPAPPAARASTRPETTCTTCAPTAAATRAGRSHGSRPRAGTRCWCASTNSRALPTWCSTGAACTRCPTRRASAGWRAGWTTPNA